MRLKVDLPIYGAAQTVPPKVLALRCDVDASVKTPIVICTSPKGEIFSIKAEELLRAAKALTS